MNHRPHDEGVEASFDVEPASRLNATTTGQLQTSLGGETVQSLNAALGARLAKERPTLAGDALRRAIASRIGIPVDRKPHVPKVARFGEIGRDGHRIVKITLETEPGIQVPALAFEPFSATARKPAVLYLDSEGKSAGASPGGYIEALVHSGYVVLAPDLRGWGETAALGGSFPHDGRYHLSMHAMLVGRTVVGMQATDLLAAFDYLAARPDVDSERIGIFSKGNAEVVALLAAALEPRIHQIACEGGPMSYLDIVRARFHDEIADIAIPACWNSSICPMSPPRLRRANCGRLIPLCRAARRNCLERSLRSISPPNAPMHKCVRQRIFGLQLTRKDGHSRKSTVSG